MSKWMIGVGLMAIAMGVGMTACDVVEAREGRGGHGHGGHHGGGHHGGHGGHGGGASVSAPSTPSVSVSGDAGALLITGGAGPSAKDIDKLVAAIKTCEMTRPNLAIGDYRASTGAWSFMTFDDTVWPYVQRCMAGEGYPAYGADYTNVSDFGKK